MTTISRAGAIGAALLGVAATQPAMAQSEGVLEEITVTAQKREQSINDIGVTVSAFSDQQMEALGIETTTDVMDFTPGATLTYAGQGTPIYTIRGIGF